MDASAGSPKVWMTSLRGHRTLSDGVLYYNVSVTTTDGFTYSVLRRYLDFSSLSQQLREVNRGLPDYLQCLDLPPAPPRRLFVGAPGAAAISRQQNELQQWLSKVLEEANQAADGGFLLKEINDFVEVEEMHPSGQAKRHASPGRKRLVEGYESTSPPTQKYGPPSNWEQEPILESPSAEDGDSKVGKSPSGTW
eukprot:CAMPEP_0113936844 /NCGR_PEP_ID=MMETSP1339-20121228/3618_1 /TAXON_ID=94617 /ORGANISM="Fibrocapsa japonica" /LENGTH=193 /DNA_ID=CAMNT_0000939405 /DNA_START=110 /DNA_END=688 /DNA_ORIENTATION=- /assembly_acc=CAM_ASM_000762